MNLPTGTVTFLFTDIEGSTRLWERFPDAMRLALQRHDALLKAAIESHNGYVFKTVGDAFCAAFHTASDALNAALEAHLALAAVEWTEIGPLLVRMGLHTGEALERDNDYFGPTLNRVARLQAIGHGQQTLLSQATCTLVQNIVPAIATLRDLGLHRLKDLAEPEHVWQLNHASLPQEFPPLKSLDYLPTNLPQQMTSFIGREKEMNEIKERLQRTRLLTLTGSGGCGKTRLALQSGAELLEQYTDGVWLVELAPLSDPSLVPQTVAEVMRVRETQGESIAKTLSGALKDRQTLLVLDNCEHVLDASAQLVEALLKTCPKVKFLVSSREALGIGGESAYRVPSLSLPDLKQEQTPQSLSEFESVALFIERTMAVKSDFTVTRQNASSLASVCHRLDGIPLAIELAAARIRSMTVEELGKRLDDRFRILTGGSRTALPRQQTLRALIDWSYDLLEDNQKSLLSRLSVFSGGWALEAAEQVCSGHGVEDWEMLDLLTVLYDKSLIIAEELGERTRYRLLETVRQYARERLASDPEGTLYRRQHRDYFLALVKEARSQLQGPEQAQWLEVLEREHDNLRQALTFCLEEPGEVETGLQMAVTLQLFWQVRGHLSEGRECFAALLAHPDATERTRARANALNAAGLLAWYQADYASSRSLHEECLAIRIELGDRRGVAGSLHNLGNVAKDQGDYQTAKALYEEALQINREVGNRLWESYNLGSLGIIAKDQADYDSARSLHEQSLAISRELGNNLGIASALGNLGVVVENQGDYASARSLVEQSLEIHRELGNKQGISNALHNLANIAQYQGDYASARSLVEQSLAIQREVGNKQSISNSLNNLGKLALLQHDYASARAFFEQSLAIQRELGERQGIATSLESFASLNAIDSQHRQAARLLAAADHLRDQIRFPMSPIAQEKHESEVTAIFAILGEEAFSSAWEDGRSLTLEQAMDLALKEKEDA